MKLKKILTILLTIFVIWGTTILLINNYVKPTDTYLIEFDFNITESSVGFDLSEDKLHFGNIPSKEGSGSTRTIEISNNNNYNKRIEFLISSNTSLGKYFSIEPLGKRILKANSTENFEITLIIDSSLKKKKYEGVIIINTFKALPWEKNKFLITNNDLKGTIWSNENFNDIININNRIIKKD